MSDTTIEMVVTAEVKTARRAAGSAFQERKQARLQEYRASLAAAEAHKMEEDAAKKVQAAAAWKANEKKRMEMQATVKAWAAEKADVKAAEEEQLAKDNKAASHKAKAEWTARKSTAQLMRPFKMNTSNRTARGMTSPEQTKQNLGNLEAFSKWTKPEQASKRQATVATPFTLSESNAKPKNNIVEAQSEAKEEVRSAESRVIDEKLQDTTMADRTTASADKRERKASTLALASALAAASPTKEVTAQRLAYSDKFKDTDMQDRDLVLGAKRERKASAAAADAALAASPTRIPLLRSSKAKDLKEMLEDTSAEDRDAVFASKRERKAATAAAAAALAASPTRIPLPRSATASALKKKYDGTTAEDRCLDSSARRERKASAAAAASALAASPTKKSLPKSAAARAYQNKYQDTTAEDREQIRKDQRKSRSARKCLSTENQASSNVAPQNTPIARRTRI